MERLQASWKRIADGKGGSTVGNRNQLQSEINDVSLLFFSFPSIAVLVAHRLISYLCGAFVYIQQNKQQIQSSLHALMSNLNETQKDLSEAHEAVEQKETLQDLQEQIKTGKVGINYETGELSASGGGNSSSISSALLAAGKMSSSSHGGTTTGGRHAEDMAAAVSKIQQEADPAILHIDVNLLEDIVLLSVATAIGGR